GVQRPSMSYGAACAELDNDGRLDLVVNNIDAPAFVYENVGAAARSSVARHFLQVKLLGPPAHPISGAVGATIVAVAGGRTQTLYYSPYRGYMSSMDQRAQFGLGRATRVDTLSVTWPDGTEQILHDVPVDTAI